MHAPNFSKLVLFCAAALFQGLCLVLIPASSFIFKSMMTAGITDQQYGFLFLPQITAATAASVFFKNLLGRLSTEKIFYAGILCNVIHLLLLAFSSTMANTVQNLFLILMTCNIFLGAGFGLLVGVLNLMTVEIFSENRDGVLTGLHASLGVGAALSPLFVNFFFEHNLWIWSVWVCLSYSIVIFLASLILRPAQMVIQGRPSPFSEDKPASLPMPAGAKLFLITIVVYGIAEAILGNWTTIYLSEERGFSVRTASAALSMFWLSLTAGRILASFLTIKIDARILYRISPALIAASLFAIITARAESHIVPLYILAGLGCSYFFPISISLATQYFEAWREKISTLSVAALMLGVGIGSSFIGFLKNSMVIGLNQAFMIAALCAVVIGFSAFGMTRQKLEHAKI